MTHIHDPLSEYTRLRDAVAKVYYAAHWMPDKYVEGEGQMWEELRDAAGLVKGLSPKPEGGNA